MRHLKTILCIITICFATQADAQIWKKLGKKVEKAAEKTLEKKVEQKTERETEKAFDSTFNNSKKNKKTKKRPLGISTAKVDPASSYSFSHKYVMQITSDKKSVNLNYYLTNSGNYIGTSIEDKKGNADHISVIDIDRKAMFMFMENKGDKSRMSLSLDFEETTEKAINDTDVSINPTGNTKTILGYTCQEYKVTAQDMKGSVWVTQSAGISFVKSFYNIKEKKGASQSWMKMLNGLTMEMDMIDTSKRKPKTIKMTCIALDKNNLTIKSNDYKKLM
ncbi:DUF4412 domain-containing protein [Olleya sp. R77988]|uniref:DUF4412 domain-containing protein n=1 Tax=Olleya sp. R77988 TaxID=3093875 RepID=UPI0037C9981C